MRFVVGVVDQRAVHRGVARRQFVLHLIYAIYKVYIYLLSLTIPKDHSEHVFHKRNARRIENELDLADRPQYTLASRQALAKKQHNSAQ